MPHHIMNRACLRLGRSLGLLLTISTGLALTGCKWLQAESSQLKSASPATDAFLQPDDSNTDTEDSVEYYVNQYLYSTEMFPRERDIPVRIAELMTNFSEKSALEAKNSTVRAYAPPLQLTGDRGIDESRIYRILLVASDLPEDVEFLDH